MRRVVITGIGALTPIGNNLEDFWNNLKAGKSGAANITYFDTEKFRAKFACQLKDFDLADVLFEAQNRIEEIWNAFLKENEKLKLNVLKHIPYFNLN